MNVEGCVLVVMFIKVLKHLLNDVQPM